ncbi:hypothetical protein SASPL_109091 [Salvia splendens]|uniref:Uncharacterized protein n=1 Tax=Salvia splendens TaxID=180675 RepID=A0A8X8YE94_SALSN|nr:hypothetical protein SASPL_109091 [Salvia splendens]
MENCAGRREEETMELLEYGNNGVNARIGDFKAARKKEIKLKLAFGESELEVAVGGADFISHEKCWEEHESEVDAADMYAAAPVVVSDEIWASDAMGVSRSRSICSFRGGGGADEMMNDCALSSAKISYVTSGIFLDLDKQFGFFNDSEAPPRQSGFRGVEQFDRTYSLPNRIVFPAKESDFSMMDESAL